MTAAMYRDKEQSMKNAPHIIFAGGGTAGHVLPGLAVAEAIVQLIPRARISFWGAGKPLERKLVNEAGFEYEAIPAMPLAVSPGGAISFVATNLRGFYRAGAMLRTARARLVIGLGSYASVPTVRAARRSGIPYLLIEQNAIPGRATRWLASAAQHIHLAYEAARAALPSGAIASVSGCPIRAEFLAARQLSPDENRQRRLVVLGGSGGARTLNEQVPLALYRATDSLAGWQIIHQTGPRDVAATANRYRKLGLGAQVGSFITNLASTLARTDFVIGRAGGSTLAELAALGVPALLLPYPHAKDDHQFRNAELYLAAHACRLIDERTVKGRLDHAIGDETLKLATDELLRRRLRLGMQSLARPNAAQEIAAHALGLIADRRTRSA
jgi:UDP-N-acetylglucosamine--N-acetylmuramyl-(pentapeptide) pyrophosphoryl-undecaprenol N-acetylglucosamine transferase